MNMKWITFFSLLGLLNNLQAQEVWYPHYNFIDFLQENEVPISMPLVGGLSTPLFGNVDLNQDGISDLVVFDRQGENVLTFLNEGVEQEINYIYAPEYEAIFPSLKIWAIFKDFDKDGIVDIFTDYAQRYIQVYKGARDENGTLFFTLHQELLKATAGIVSDFHLPVIDDIDGDGDIDILVPNLAKTITYYKNTAVENGWPLDTLPFVQASTCWGGIRASFTVDLAATLDYCIDSLPATSPTIYPKHGANISLTTFDINKDGAKELFLSQSFDKYIVQLNNGGTPQNARMLSQDTIFPTYDIPAKFTFGSVSVVDVNNDEKEDLIIGQGNHENVPNLTNQIYLQDDNQQFLLHDQQLFQDQILDKGTWSYPIFWDANKDGLVDILVSATTNKQGKFIATVSLWQQQVIGKRISYQLVTTDFSQLSQLQEVVLYPTFGDIDNDGDDDMVIGNKGGGLLVYEQIDRENDLPIFELVNSNLQQIDVGLYSTPQLVDVNEDGLLDLLIGRRFGRVSYFRNEGTKEQADFKVVSNHWGKTETFDFGTSAITYSVPRLVKDEDNTKLYLAHQNGKIASYEVNLTQDTFKLLKNNILPKNIGRHVAPTFGDLNQNGSLDMLVGNIRGGLNFFSPNLPYLTEPLPEGLSTTFSAKLIPNITTRDFCIFLTGLVDNQDIQYTIYDSTGKLIVSRNISFSQATGQQSYPIQLPNQASGLYLVEIIHGTERSVKKLIIQ